MTTRRIVKTQLTAFLIVAVLLAAGVAAQGGTASNPEVSDPAGDVFDEFTGQAESGPDVSNVDLRAIWFAEVGTSDYAITIQVDDLTSPPEFRPARTVHSYEVFFENGGDAFKATLFRDAVGQSNGLIDIQGVSENGSPRTDAGTASLAFDATADTITFTLPRVWSVQDENGNTVTFTFSDGTVLTGIRGVSYEGVGDAFGCSPCTPMDRTAVGRDFEFGADDNGDGGNNDDRQHAKAINDHDCDDTEWHFIINQLESTSDAPAEIRVSWRNGAVETVPLGPPSSDGVAHYTTTSHLDSVVTEATAVLPADWDGHFNLSHGPCGPLKQTGVLDPKVDRMLPFPEPADYVCFQAPEQPTNCA